MELESLRLDFQQTQKSSNQSFKQEKQQIIIKPLYPDKKMKEFGKPSL